MKKFFIVIVLLCLMSNFSNCFAFDHTGMWWDVNKQGSGVYIDFTEGPNAVCGSWYLYDDRGNPLWLTFMGNVDRNLLNADLYRFTGPPLGSEWDSSLIRGENAGSVTIDFSNPDALNMDYEIDGIRGTMSLTRFSSQACGGM